MRQMTAEQSPQTRGSFTTRAQLGHHRPVLSCGLVEAGVSSGISVKSVSRKQSRQEAERQRVQEYTERTVDRYFQQGRWKALLVAITVVIGLLLLLIAGGGHGHLTLAFVLLPVLFVGLVEIPRSLWPVADATLAIQHQLLDRASLFQRPPPFA